MWLCKEHRDLVVNRGNFDQRGKDISSQQWYKFFGLSQPIAPQGVDVNRAPDYDVFLSHAGTEKQGIVSFIYKYLTNAKLEVFVDYDDKKSLRPADHAPTKMEQAAWTAPVGLFVLSKEFLQRKWPVKELRIFLERRKNGENVKILPCFYGLDAWEKDPSLTSEQKSLLREVSEFTGRERRFGLSFEEALVSRLTLDVVQLVAEAKDQGGSSTQAGSTSALGKHLMKHFFKSCSFIQRALLLRHLLPIKWTDVSFLKSPKIILLQLLFFRLFFFQVVNLAWSLFNRGCTSGEKSINAE